MKDDPEESKIKKRMDDLHNEIDIMKEKFRLTDMNFNYIQKELLTSNFMNENTKFANFEELLKSGNFKVENDIQFKVLQDTDKWNNFIQENTSFKNWNDMLRAAVLERATRKLNG